MANAEGYARTNYFYVEDEEAFNAALPHSLTQYVNAEGRICLLAEGDWPSEVEDENGEYQDWSLLSLMPFIREGEVVVVQCVGHEKLLYVWGYSIAYLRSGEEIKTCHVNIEDIGEKVKAEFGTSPQTRAAY